MQACDAIQCAERRRKKPRVDVRPCHLSACLLLTMRVPAPYPAPAFLAGSVPGIMVMHVANIGT